jgi:hypothetical protein
MPEIEVEKFPLMLDIRAVVAITARPYVCEVTPEALLTRSNDTVRFQNLTQGKAVVVFDDEKAIGRNRIEIPANGDTDVLLGATPGSYLYSVLCEDPLALTDKAYRPRIIICRPIT